MSLIAFFSSLLLQVFLLCREGEAAITAFTSKPSDPTYTQETFNITLLWNYTLNGEVGFARFENVTGDVDVTIANRFGSGSTTVQSGFQERFIADISDTQAWLTIVYVKRSDQGTYQFDMNPTLGVGIKNKVELIVRYPPVITNISINQTVNENDNVTLNYTISDGNPPANITWTRLSDNSIVTFPLTITGTKDQGFYRFTADNRVGSAVNADVFITVENYSPENTILTTGLGADNIVVVNMTFNLTCSAQANPPAKYPFYKEQEIKFTTTNGSNVAVYTTSVTEGMNQVKFSCTPFNDYGDGPTAMVTVIVHYPPKIITAPLSQSLEEESEAILFCNASGNPQPNITWTKLGSNSAFPPSESLTLTNLKKEDDGVYKCLVQNYFGPVEATATITVLYAPTVTIQQCSTPVTEGGNATLYCNATGNPVPSTAWIRAGQVVTNNKMLVLAAIKRDESGNYECLAWNGIGNNSTKSCTIDVQYPPKITSPKAGRKKAESGDTIECDAEGYPSPTYVWRNGTGGVVANEKTFTLNYDGNYTCNASNKLGSDTHSIVIEIEGYNFHLEVLVEKLDGEVVDLVSVDDPKRVVDNFVLEEKLNGVVVGFKSEDKDLNSITTKEFIEKFENEMNKLYTNDSRYNRTDVTGLRKGSVIVSFVLYFTTPVTTSEGLAKLKAATDNGTLGPFTVGALKIIQNVNPTSTPSVSSTGSTTAVPPVVTTAESPTEGPPWMIIGAVVGGVVVMVVIIAVVAWCVHKKRKCRRKGTKIGNSESDVPVEGLVNGGYADSGPPSANGANRTDASVLLHEQPTAAAPPTYAVVDKKKKKEKKGDKKEDHNVAKQDVPDYAVVDKSQKKKKEVVEDAYAQVDMSKKSKKKPKPGEMLYADLGDFKPTQMQPTQMPAVSTSPEPLPPIKRPPAYEETQYADIVQVMKGNTTVPDTSNSQGIEMTYANVQGGKEKPRETANGGGNEEKPKDNANGGGNEEKPKDNANGGGNEGKPKVTRM